MQIFQRLADQLRCPGIAIQLCLRIVTGDDTSLINQLDLLLQWQAGSNRLQRFNREDTLHGVFDKMAIACFTAGQGLLGLFTLGHILYRTKKNNRFIRRIKFEFKSNLYPADLAIGSYQPVMQTAYLCFGRRCDRPHFLHILLMKLPIIRVYP